MTTFVHCRGCGEKIHESAPSCPKCGAPQVIAAVAAPSRDAVHSAKSGYSAVPWFRRRWFTILCLLSIAPIAAVLSLTGPIYFLHRSEVKTFPKKTITVLVCLASANWMFQLLAPIGSSATAWHWVLMILMSLVLGFKNQWPEK